jgi:hypothetical protein
MIMKKQLLLLVMILLPMVASADGILINGINYILDSETKKAQVTSHYSYKNDIVIPDKITFQNVEYTVTSIGNYAFLNRDITNVTISNSVINIGIEAFAGCDHINNFTLGNGIRDIGHRAFTNSSIENLIIHDIESWLQISFPYDSQYKTYYGCNPVSYAKHFIVNGEELENLVIPEGTEYIPTQAFVGCRSIKSITFPESIYGISVAAFYNCNNLEYLSIPDNITIIQQDAFGSCYGLKKVSLGNGLETLRANAFSNCAKLESLTLSDKLELINEETFMNCTSLKFVTIPNGVKEIRSRAFYGCSSLELLILGTGIQKITGITAYYVDYGNSFSNCPNLKDVYCYANIVPYITDGAFQNSNNANSTLHVPETLLNSYLSKNEWNQFGSITKISPTAYKFIVMIDGIPYSFRFIEHGDIIPAELLPTKEGYTFLSNSEIPTIMPAHDVTISGTFAINKYKLIYIVDGAEYKSYELEYGAAITPELAPTKEGYTFSGWSEIPETMPAHDVTVTGSFAINKYKLIYKVDGAEYKSYDIEYGTKITPEPAPTKEGYTFSGWSEIPETMPAHDVIVTGSFTKGVYNLTYMVDDEVYKTLSYDYGATINPEPAPTKEGYTFSGWSEIPATMPAHDVIVTGSFTINKYKLVYQVDGAEYKSYELEFGTTITPEPVPTKEGYTFSGWSEIPATMPAHDVTVTGSFTVNQYTITYIIDNEVYTTQTVDYGSTIIPPSAPEREGYDFAWADYPETMPAHDITIYGTYTTGIEAIMAAEANCQIFALDGKPLNKPQKGINIVRMSNGQIRKLVVK